MMDAAEYTEGFAKWNTAGLGNNVYVRIGYEPLEAAKVVPAVAQYLSIVKKYGGLTSALGSSPRPRSCSGPPRPRRADRRSPASA